MRIAKLAAAFAAVILLPALGFSATVDVSVANFAFSPPNVSVAPGDTVRWTFLSTHTTTSNVATPPEPWDSGTRSSGVFTHTFNTPGTYSYHCNIHPFMTGSVTVTLAAPTVTAANPSPAPPGTVITLTGTGFQTGVTVTFRGVASPAVTFVSSTSLQASVPNIPAGAATIVVTNPDMQTGSFTGFVVAAVAIPLLSRDALLLLALGIAIAAALALRK
jgi:plastocyanin